MVRCGFYSYRVHHHCCHCSLYFYGTLYHIPRFFLISYKHLQDSCIFHLFLHLHLLTATFHMPHCLATCATAIPLDTRTVPHFMGLFHYTPTCHHLRPHTHIHYHQLTGAATCLLPASCDCVFTAFSGTDCVSSPPLHFIPFSTFLLHHH